jgi:hypothetical protein
MTKFELNSSCKVEIILGPHEIKSDQPNNFRGRSLLQISIEIFSLVPEAKHTDTRTDGHELLSNVKVDWVALQLRIRKVQVSAMRPATLSFFFLSFPGATGVVP